MRALAVLLLVGCATTDAAGVLLDMQPPRPAIAGAYDFDLLDRVRGDACVGKGAATYWLVGEPFDRIPGALRSVVGAALFHILDDHPAFDSIVATRVIVTAKDAETTCATVYGRGIRLTKARPPEAPAAPPAEKPAPTESDDDDDKPPDKDNDPFDNPHGRRWR